MNVRTNACLIASIITVSCAAPPPESDAQCTIVSPEKEPPPEFGQLQLGMTVDEARRILGKPGYSPVDGVDYYGYPGMCSTDGGPDAGCYIGIDYHDYLAEPAIPDNVGAWTVQYCMWGGIGE